MAQAVSFSGQAGKLMGEHLAHPHVLFVLTGCPVVLFDNPRVHDELVAHQDWLKGVFIVPAAHAHQPRERQPVSSAAGSAEMPLGVLRKPVERL